MIRAKPESTSCQAGVPTREKRYRLAAIAILVPLGVVACYLFILLIKYGVLGYKVEGTAPRLADVPEIGPVLATKLETNGPVAYEIWYDPHQTYCYDIVGRTSWDSLAELAESLDDLYIDPGNVRQPNPELDDVVIAVERINRAGGRRIEWGTGFEGEDVYMLSGGKPAMVGGFYRRSDGLFWFFGNGLAR